VGAVALISLGEEIFDERLLGTTGPLLLEAIGGGIDPGVSVAGNRAHADPPVP
jgi:hypothetical protein